MTDRAPTWARDSATSVLRRSRPRGCGTSRPTCDVGMARAPTGRGTRRDASRPTWDRRNGSRPRGRGTRQREGLDGHAHVGAVPVPLVPRGAVAPWPFRARRDRNLSRAHLVAWSRFLCPHLSTPYGFDVSATEHDVAQIGMA